MSHFIRTIRGSLPIIAKALSQKYNVRVEFGGHEACATRDKITLPALPPEDDKANVLANGYVDHEAGHVRLTDFSYLEACNTALEQDTFNILEDVRIECEMGRLYPGCKFNLKRLTDLLVREGDLPAPSASWTPAQTLLSYILYSLRLVILEQQAFLELAAAAERRARQRLSGLVVDRVDSVLARAAAPKSTGDVYCLTRELMDS